jgi:RNA polymerase sigma-70 factor (ECF subfamily)
MDSGVHCGRQWGEQVLNEEFPEVLAAAARGDELAFSALYRDVHPALLRYLRAMSWDIAEDAASECWFEVARGLGAFVGPEPAFRAWVFAIARRKLIDRIRYEARRPTAELSDLDLGGPLRRDVADDVVEMDATYRALALVQTLPTDQAEAVLLRVVAGLEYSDVARIMDRSAGAVRVLVHRGLRRLEGLVGETGSSRGGVTP